jgi:Ger(x)C family germination protein
VLNLQGSGADLSQAIAAIQQQSDVLISLWATNLVLLGSAMAQTNLNTQMNYLLRDTEFSLPAQVAVVQGRASTLLVKSSVPQSPAIAILQQLTYSNLNPLGAVPISFWQFMGRLQTPYRAAWAPLLAETPQGYQAAGTALFQGDRMSGALDAQQTWTLGWLIKRGGYGVLTFTDKQGQLVGLNIVGRHLHLRTKSASSASLDLKLNTKLQEGYGLSLASHRLITELDTQASTAAQSQVRQMVDRLQAAGSDVLGLGELVRQRSPKAVANWPQTFSHMHIAIHVTVDILPSGRLAH